NCRNTKPIGEELSLVTGFEKTPYLPTKIEGIPVEYRFHKNTEEQVNYLEQILLRLLKRKIQPERITLLSPFKYDHSIVSHTNSDKFEILDLSKSPHENQGDDCLTFSTIQGFKGMENSYIILTDIIRLLDDEFNSLLYVGMSRAKVGLYLLLDSRLRENYNKLVKKGVDE
ncbi:MAG: hypothetical protein H8D45_05820, partial [Bacteroidetes bacterium]|nr:hypothetical protein [Bacteroidota bacterium]